MHPKFVRLLFLFGLSLVGGISRDAYADLCVQHQRQFPQSYIGTVRPDPNNPKEVDKEWIGRISIGEDNIVKFPDGPIWDGDSTANDDANYLSGILPGTNKTEFASLGWKHPVNLAVSGDYVPTVLYRLYAMEQKINFRTEAPPATLERTLANALFRVKSPFLVLHVGTNELYKSEPAQDIVADVEALTCELHRDLPLVGKIVVVSVYPRGPFFNLDVAKRIQINAGLSTAAATHQFPFLFVDATHYLEELCKNNFDSNGQCSDFKDLTHPKAQAAYGVDKMIARAVR
jgi:hypothetical protein